MRIRALADVVGEIRDRPATHGIRIVGVDGKSGSGKTTLAARLAAACDAPTIHVDDFVSWSDFSGWWPRFDSGVLTPLLSGHDATFAIRDWSGDEFGSSLRGSKTVRWNEIVIVEGVTCTRRATDGLLACSVWVDAPRDVRLQRGIARDGETHRHLWDKWMIAEDAFFDADRTRDRADLLVDAASKLHHDAGLELVVSSL